MTYSFKNYAEALFELAEEENKLGVIYDELMLINGIIIQNAAYAKIFSSPAVSAEEKTKLISEAFFNADETLLKFLKLLAKNGLVFALSSIFKSYEELYFEKCGITVAEAKTAVPMTEEEKKHLIKNLEKKTGKSVRLLNSVDPDIIGGVVLSLDGKMLDASIKTKLNRFKKGLAH